MFGDARREIAMERNAIRSRIADAFAGRAIHFFRHVVRRTILNPLPPVSLSSPATAILNILRALSARSARLFREYIYTKRVN